VSGAARAKIEALEQRGLYDTSPMKDKFESSENKTRIPSFSGASNPEKAFQHAAAHGPPPTDHNVHSMFSPPKNGQKLPPMP